MINEKKIKAWILAKAKLNTAKKQELELRLPICKEILADKVKGAKKRIIGGFILTATAKLNEKIDADLLKELWPGLTAEEKNCIKFTPSIKAKEFNKLKSALLLHRAIDSKPGTPTLTLK